MIKIRIVVESIGLLCLLVCFAAPWSTVPPAELPELACTLSEPAGVYLFGTFCGYTWSDLNDMTLSRDFTIPWAVVVVRWLVVAHVLSVACAIVLEFTRLSKLVEIVLTVTVCTMFLSLSFYDNLVDSDRFIENVSTQGAGFFFLCASVINLLSLLFYELMFI
jgi:hypothetical protein